MSKKRKSKKEKQLDLGLKQSPKNLIYRFKRSFDRFLVKFEVKEFLRSPLTWLVITFSISFIALMLYKLFTNISSYPQELPIWQNQTSLQRRLESKELLYFYPTAGVFALIFGSVLSNIFYHKEKFLSKILLLSSLLSIVGLTFAFLKLIP